MWRVEGAGLRRLKNSLKERMPKRQVGGAAQLAEGVMMGQNSCLSWPKWNFGCIKTYLVLSQPKLWDMKGRGARFFCGKTCDLERTVTFIHFEVDDQVN